MPVYHVSVANFVTIETLCRYVNLQLSTVQHFYLLSGNVDKIFIETFKCMVKFDNKMQLLIAIYSMQI